MASALRQIEEHASTFNLMEISTTVSTASNIVTSIPGGTVTTSSTLGTTDSLAATKDTGARKAWKLGWTGKGAGIGILDNYTGRGVTVFQVLGNRNKVKRSHGESVEFVAMQVAPEATFTSLPFSVGCHLLPGTQARQIASAFDAFERAGAHIVNNSWSTSRYFSGSCSGQPAGLRSPDLWQRLVDSTVKSDISFLKLALPTGSKESYDTNMVFVFAAGNDYGKCSLGIEKCNLYASSIWELRKTKETANAGDRVIFAGALADGKSEMASYSQRAGQMKNDYIVAHDDIAVSKHGAGTSFSAPRIAGAAALVRHKFPSLNGPKLKQVLIRSADDLGATGPDEIFGSGRLNVMSALSPIGGLTK